MLMTLDCIGTVKGPGETPNEYTFIAPDPQRRVKFGEFVYYIGLADGEEGARLSLDSGEYGRS
mgnify:CR=1 FL=1